MPAQQDPAERPEGLESRPEIRALPGDGDRPDWLVGSEDIVQGGKEAEGPTRPTLAEAPAREPLKVIPGGKPSPPQGWSGAASSVPKLSVVPSPAPHDDFEEETSSLPEREAEIPARDGEEPDETMAPAPPAFQPLEEPWYLVLGEALATQRRIQVALLVVAAAVAAFFFWPRAGGTGASLGSILHHPETFEGRSVVVRGEVLEIFEVGTGRAFQLRQGRDVVVVDSTLREPRVHDRVEVHGVVSTGYLDGAPRVAIFEGAAP